MAKKTKFNVSKDKEKRTYNGIIFDSELEMKYYRDVLLPARESMEVLNIERQVEYILQPAFIYKGKKYQAIKYKADFVVTYKNNDTKTIDIKGYADATALLKRKIFYYTYPEFDYVWIGYSLIDGGWVTYEEIQAGRKARKTLRVKGEKGNGDKKENK